MGTSNQKARTRANMAGAPAPVNPGGRYYTPDDLALACTRAMVPWVGNRVLRPPRSSETPLRIIEPSVGGGAFARAARTVFGSSAVIYGVDNYAPSTGFGYCDAFDVGDWPEVAGRSGGGIRGDLVLMNPDFGVAEPHVAAALKVAPFVGALLRLSWLAGRGRRDRLWCYRPPAEVHVISDRPSFTGTGASSEDYAWFVWAAGVVDTRLTWLDWRKADTRGGAE